MKNIMDNVMDKKYVSVAVVFIFILIFYTTFLFLINKQFISTNPIVVANTKNANTTTDAAKLSINKPDGKPFVVKSSNVKGIYLTQWTLENTALLNYLIKNAKKVGIDTFIVDLELPSKRYEKNIKLLKENNLTYVARIIMFPDGGRPEQIENPAVWQRKFALVKQAVEWGAGSIQLDYIRYSSKMPASSEHAKNIFKIIQWYKNKLEEVNVPLQVDVFGITSLGESKHIGQNVQMFAEAVDAICPMVYPSHFVPFPDHFKTPYETVYKSLALLQKQFDNKMPIKMYAYIELSNYHYPMTREKTLEYIQAQIRAVQEVGADGWYAWSPHNRYDNLFRVLGANIEESPESKGI